LVGEYAISWSNSTTVPWGVPPGGNIAKALNALVSYSQLPAVVASRNGSLSNHSWGQAGYVALSANGFAPQPTWNPTYPVTPFTHASSGASLASTIPLVNSSFSTVELR